MFCLLSRAYIITPLIAALCSLAACTPSYMQSSSEAIARKLQIYDDYSIERWHHHSFAHSAGFCIGSQQLAAFDRDSLLQTIADSFSQQFRQSVVVDPMLGLHAARQHMLCSTSDYLAYVDQLQTLCPPVEDAAGEQIEPVASGDCGEQFSSLRLSITIVAVPTATVIDRIQITAKKSWTGWQGGGDQPQLAQLMNRLAQTLAGEAQR